MSTERILELARALTRDEFVKRHPGHYLVITDRGEDEPPSSFETVDATTTPSAFLAARPSLEVHPIVKAPGNPYPDRISVGRARNCDVVLRFASVSKLHASFRPRADGQLDVVDLGSQLGTRVNGRAATPNELARVAPGFVLMLGRVATRIADGRMVWDLVRAQAAIDAMSAPPGSGARGSSPGAAPPTPRAPTSAPPGPRSSPGAGAPRTGAQPGSVPPGARGSSPGPAPPAPRSGSPGSGGATSQSGRFPAVTPPRAAPSSSGPARSPHDTGPVPRLPHDTGPVPRSPHDTGPVPRNPNDTGPVPRKADDTGPVPGSAPPGTQRSR